MFIKDILFIEDINVCFCDKKR